MKKNIIIITIILILILLLGAAFITYKNTLASKKIFRNDYAEEDGVGIIVEMDNNAIKLKDSVDTTKVSYILHMDTSNPIIKNINGEKINLSNLNIGDEIEFSYKENLNNLGYLIKPVYNIEIIQVIADNSDNHMTEDDLSYNDFVYDIPTFMNDYIEIRLLSVKQFPNNNSYTKCDIAKKDNDEDIIVENLKYNNISYENNTNEQLTTISIDAPNWNDTLETGNYVFRFENEILGLIKIPFKVNKYGGLQW